jgi:hypothetical protein
VTTLDRPVETNEFLENTSVSAALEVDDNDTSQFEIVSEPAPEGYSPERKTPGRQRRASYFDDQLRAANVFGQGWQRVPVTSPEHKAFVQRELNRAKLFLNGPGRLDGECEIGLDLDDKKEDALYYRSREAQKRERKDSGVSALAANAENDGVVDPDGDNDE